MREAIGGTWLFYLVIFFVLLFAGYMCLSINYTRAFNVKDTIINEIERNGGIKNFSNMNDRTHTTEDYALKNITQYMKKVGYRTEGNCDDYQYGCSRDGNCIDNPKGLYAFCLSEIKAEKEYTMNVPGEFIYVSYYKVKVFYQLDLPVIRSIFDFNIKGDTKLLYKTENRHEGGN